MQENFNIVTNMGVISKEVYNNENFSLGVVIHNEDLQHDYRVRATQDSLLGESYPDFFGFQAFLLEELDASGNGTGEYVIAFRGTEATPFSYQSIADLASDASMAVGNFTTQMKLALAFVDAALDQYGSQGLSTDNLTFTGHSLGGSLAEVAGYTFGSETYAYNPFGVKWSLMISPIAYNATILTLGINSVRSADSITNIVNVGDDFSDPITGVGSHLLNSYIGDIEYIKNSESGSLAPHGMDALNMSIAIYNNLLEMFPEETYASITNAIELLATDKQEMPEFLKSLGKILNVSNPSNSKDFSTAIKDAVISLQLSLSLVPLTNDTEENITPLSPYDIISNARTDIAYRYALVNLNPFSIVGANIIYDSFNQNGELEIYNSTTGDGQLSNMYLADRAEMLANFIYANINDSVNSGSQIIYHDYAKGITLNEVHFADVSAPNPERTIAFGCAGNDGFIEGTSSLWAGNHNDRLYGMGGNDYLLGYDGDDRLEGGNGRDTMSGGEGDDTLIGGDDVDTYVINTGDGHDTITDTGLNFLKINGEIFTGAFIQNEVSGDYTCVQGDQVYSISFDSEGALLTIDDDTSVKFLNYSSAEDFINNSFGIALFDSIESEDTITVTGSAANEFTLQGGSNLNLYLFDENYRYISNLPASETSIEPGVSLIQYGLSGNDLLNGVQGSDSLIYGGDGNDIVQGYNEWSIDLENIYSENGQKDFLSGGDGNDDIHGFAEDDYLYGGNNNDLLDGGTGDDILVGGDGNDILVGDLGDDWLYGGDGNDFIAADMQASVDLPLELVSDPDAARAYQFGLLSQSDFGEMKTSTSLPEEAVSSLLQFEDTFSDGTYRYWTDVNIRKWDYNNSNAAEGYKTSKNQLFGGAGDDVLYGGDGDDVLFGGDDNDELYGEALTSEAGGNDTIYGGNGNDYLFSGAGENYLYGGAGDDTYAVKNAGDTYIDDSEGYNKLVLTKQGIQYVYVYETSISIFLPNNCVVHLNDIDIENIAGTSSIDAIQLYDGTLRSIEEIVDEYGIRVGTAGEDVFVGSADADTYLGFDGDDTVFGGGGNDVLYLGLGNDYSEGGEGDDSIFLGAGDDYADGGEGNDIINGGSDDDELHGDEGSDTISGDDGSDILYGGLGDDTLDGGTGSDVMKGGGGDDLYRVDNENDEITEYADEGFDTVSVSTISAYTLPDSFEKLVLFSGSVYEGIGNSSSNYIYGNNLDNTLSGLSGEDELYGRAGDDILSGGDDNDILYGDDGHDTLSGGEGNDTLSGGDDNDYLVGGFGDDTYIYSSGRDIIDNSDGGIDQLIFDSNLPLDLLSFVRSNNDLVVSVKDSVDQVTLLNWYSDLGNRISSIMTGDGEVITPDNYYSYVTCGDPFSPSFDTLTYGSSNNDALNGTSGSDKIFGLEGDDQISGGGCGYDHLDGGAGNDIITGGAVNDNILGGDGNDELFGLRAADHMEGGDGNDFLIGGAGSDTMYGEEGDDTEYGGTGNDFILGQDGNDWLSGDLGDDFLIGGTGNDTYYYARGDGIDTIHNKDGGFDVLRFGAILLENVVFSQDENDLVITVTGMADRITVSCWFENQDYRLDEIHFADGQILIADDIVPLLDALPSLPVFSPPENPTYALIEGSEGNDLISAEDSEAPIWVALHGHGGNDLLLGDNSSTKTSFFNDGAGNDVIHFGAGNNYIEDQDGSDVYVYGAGDGSVSYSSTGTSEDTNWLIFTDGITSDRLTYLRETNDLIIRVDSDEDSQITVNDWFSGNDKQIDYIQPYGEYAISSDEIKSLISQSSDMNGVIDGTDTSETISGTAEANIINGLIGDDILSGNEGDDILYGGAGNDTLYGGEGDDDLIGGEGDDVLTGGEGYDYFDGGYGEDTVDYSLSGEGIEAYLSYGEYEEDEDFELDGESFTEIENITGSNFADVIWGDDLTNKLIGNGGDDQLIGYEGDDFLAGGNGDDSYVYNPGSGADTIDNSGGGVDSLIFTGDLTSERFSYIKNGDDLIIRIDADETTQVTVTGWFVSSDNQLSYIHPAGGNGISAATINVLFEDSSDGDDSNNQGSGTETPPANAFDTTVEGTSSAEQIVGTSGSNLLQALAGDDQLFGLSGGDWLEGGDGADYLDGGNDNDTQLGGAGNDQLGGDAGNDTLIGGLGDDIYVYRPDSGADTIDNSDGGTDWLIFTDDLTSDRLSYLQSGDDLIIRIDNTETSQVTVTGWFVSPENQLSYIQPAGQSGISATTINALFESSNNSGDDGGSTGQEGEPTTPAENTFDSTVTGTDSAEQVVGTSGNNLLQGLAGDDQLFGLSGNDWLEAGDGADYLDGGAGDDMQLGGAGDDQLGGDAGNDNLVGGVGDDKYVYRPGSGIDTIDNTGGGTDWLIFTDDLTADRLSYHRSGDDLLVKIDNSTTSMVRVKNWFEESGLRVSYIQPAGGYGISAAQIESMLVTDPASGFAAAVRGTDSDETLTGSANADQLFGYDGNDELFGLAGNDELSGGDGSDTLLGGFGDDTYSFRLGDGADTITDEAGSDTIAFGIDVTTDGFAVVKTGSTLQIGYGSNDVITMADYSDSTTGNRIENITMSDGSTMTDADINQLIQDMSAYAVTEGISLDSLSDIRQNEELMTMVAGSWQAA